MSRKHEARERYLAILRQKSDEELFAAIEDFTTVIDVWGDLPKLTAKESDCLVWSRELKRVFLLELETRTSGVAS